MPPAKRNWPANESDPGGLIQKEPFISRLLQEFSSNDEESLVGSNRRLTAPFDRDGGNNIDHLISNVRETIGVNRIALFLDNQNPSVTSDRSSPGDRLCCVGAIGIPFDVQQRCELSKRSGIGEWVIRHGQILARKDAAMDLTPGENIDVQREFNSLRCQVAIPINDREKTIGVALLGDPLIRSSFSREELQSAFQLFEEFGLFIRNFRRQKKLAWENNLLNQMFSTLHCGSLVINEDLAILKTNQAMHDFLSLDQEKILAFEDIPAALGDQIRGSVEQRLIPAPFFLSFPQDPKKRLFRITINPLADGVDRSTCLLVMIEDFSDLETAKQEAFDSAVSHLTDQLQLLGSKR